MQRKKVRFFTLTVIVYFILSGCASSSGVKIDLLNSGVINKEDAFFDFYWFSDEYNLSKKAIVSIRGNDISFLNPAPSEDLSTPNSEGFRYKSTVAFWNDDNKTTLALVKEVFEYGAYNWNLPLVYVNQEGAFRYMESFCSFESSGWYYLSQVFGIGPYRAFPINYMPSDEYWVVIDRTTRDVIWWKKR